jgi:hypothetical protein
MIMKKILNSKWFPRVFYSKPDGGKGSGVTGYFLLEWKPVFSIGILKFNEGTREAYHSHAFNALTWWLKGSVTEVKLIEPVREFGDVVSYKSNEEKDYIPSIIPKYTSRDNFHKVIAHETTYALTIRGPWKDTWREYRKDRYVTLTHGRKEI